FISDAGSHNGTYRFDLAIFHRLRSLAEADNGTHAWRGQQRKTISQIQPAKDITREKWPFHDLDSVRPPLLGLIGREEQLIAFAVQVFSDGRFKSRTHMNRVPAILRHTGQIFARGHRAQQNFWAVSPLGPPDFPRKDANSTPVNDLM